MAPGIGQEFFEMTRYRHLGPALQQKGAAPPALQFDFSEGDERIELPSANNIGCQVQQVIEQRRSLRRYKKKALTLQELSYLLWCTQGVKKAEAGLHTFRTVPSAGARHAFETFVLANRVGGLKNLLYQYMALEHKLAVVSRDDRIAEKIMFGCMGQNMVAASAATFIWAADVERMTWRYGERGYRYILLDAGHVCQNLYLAAESIGCGACAIGTFDDDVLNKTLGLDGKRHFVVYAACVGKKITNEERKNEKD
jgi:SagB-type dehydrogenase family enzyme